jgi:SAM-dependent methyltransferase
MNWQERRLAARYRHAEKYDAAEVAQYRDCCGLGWLTREDQDAALKDLMAAGPWIAGSRVLDVGAGTGVMTKILLRYPGLQVHALEPSPSMLDVLRKDPELSSVTLVEGRCDSIADRHRFAGGAFQAITAKQVCNGLWDPLVAFRNWWHWLADGGKLLILEGLYGREGWQGRWAEEVDVLPLSSCQSMAMIPYLLESVGFEIQVVEAMEATNRLPITRTPRYLVVARKPIGNGVPSETDASV